MVSRGLTLTFIVAIALLATFDQGEALKCYVCNSLTDKDCSGDPSKNAATECGPADVTPTANPAETTAKPAETTAKPAETTAKPAETTAQSAETTAQSAETTANPAGTTAQSAETTAKPAGTTTQSAETTAKPAGTTTQPAVPGNKETNEVPAPVQVKSFRKRRSILADRVSDSVCYKLIYTSGQDEVIERGCHAKENACEQLKQPTDKASAECHVCEEDECNSSSTISLGFISILAPVALVAIFRW